MKKKKICIISSSRAEYGILKELIIKLKSSKKFKTEVLVTGSHLVTKYGSTYRNIKKDKIKIDYKINVKLNKNDKFSIIKDMSNYLKVFSNTFKKIKPDLILVTGDRHEILCVAIVANIFRIRLAHIHGGETTLGSYDDGSRNAITKLSNIHFVSTNKYRTKVIQMGENPKNVFNVGSLSVETLTKIKKNDNFLNNILNFNFNKKRILISYHPLTANIEKGRKDFNELLNSLKKVKNTSLVFSYPNHDVDSDYIIVKIKEFVKKNKNSKLFKFVGQENYYQLLKNFDCIIGNSSSGIIEAPSAKIPTINIGERQEGRIMSKSIFSIKAKNVFNTLNKIYKLKGRKKINFTNPYQKKNTTKNIIEKLNKIKFNEIYK
ncbi:UDP-N-acetylglucosamine 2-epimerase [Pelagibacteraceae bacterium]|nr:UDP-N-acetylglucosamine 2-epimerase [Pelagibacteraceae bacterium]